MSDNAATTTYPLSRRAFFATSSAAALAVAAPAARADGHGDAMVYEVTRTDEEWRAMLSDQQYAILRGGRTETPKSSPLWNETAEGFYHCQGCDLQNYDGRFKVVLDKGWVFFKHAVADAALLGLDGPVPEYGQMATGIDAVTEVHCRRCGSHLGHLLVIGGQQLHCINGAALDFKPLDA